MLVAQKEFISEFLQVNQLLLTHTTSKAELLFVTYFVNSITWCLLPIRTLSYWYDRF